MITLARTSKGKDGIFGELLNDFWGVMAITLEHAYPDAFSYMPIAPVGIFTCVRGYHQLVGMKEPFETFEITGIKGHRNILFHAGNWNIDSSGCVLLGQTLSHDGKGRMITNSKETFENFMERLIGVEHFELTIQNKFDA